MSTIDNKKARKIVREFINEHLAEGKRFEIWKGLKVENVFQLITPGIMIGGGWFSIAETADEARENLRIEWIDYFGAERFNEKWESRRLSMEYSEYKGFWIVWD